MARFRIILLLLALVLAAAGCADFGTTSRQDIWLYQGTGSPPVVMDNGDVYSPFPPYHRPIK